MQRVQRYRLNTAYRQRHSNGFKKEVAGRGRDPIRPVRKEGNSVAHYTQVNKDGK